MAETTPPVIEPVSIARRELLAGLGSAGLLTGVGASARAEQNAIRRGGKLSIVLEVDVKSLDPLLGNDTVVDRHVFNLYCESLLQQDQSGKLQPWLAESWDVQDGGKTILFRLRQGVLFHDGTPLDAQAAKFCLERVIDPKIINQNKQYVTEMRSVDVIDDHTFRVNLAQPSAPFLAMMANEAGIIVSPTALKERGEEFGRRPIGSGPFVIAARQTGHIGAVRNTKYWRDGADGQKLPYLDAVDMTVNPDSSVRLLQVLSAAAQLCDAIGTNLFAQARAGKGVHLVDYDLGATFVTSFNLRRPPFDNIELRKAIALGIDRKALAQVLTGGAGVPLKGVEPPGSWVYDDRLRGHVYDPDQARALFKKSGFHGPITLSLVQRDTDRQIAEMMQGMLGDIGANLRLAALERTTFLAKVKRFDFDLALTKSLPMQRPDPQLQYAYAYSRIATLNYSGFHNDQIYDLVDAAKIEFDNQKRKAIYVKIQQLVLDNYYQTFLFWDPTREVASDKLQNIRHDATGIWRYEEMWLQA